MGKLVGGAEQRLQRRSQVAVGLGVLHLLDGKLGECMDGFAGERTGQRGVEWAHAHASEGFFEVVDTAAGEGVA